MSIYDGGWVKERDLPGHFEGSEETDTAKNRHAEGRHDLLRDKHELQDGADHNDEVEPAHKEVNDQ